MPEPAPRARGMQRESVSVSLAKMAWYYHAHLAKYVIPAFLQMIELYCCGSDRSMQLAMKFFANEQNGLLFHRSEGFWKASFW
jgi:hypothetical protein